MTPNEIQKKLEALKSEATTALTDKTRKEGQIVEIDKTLANNYGLHSIAEVDLELQNLDKEIAKVEAVINSDYENLVKEFGL